MPRSFCVKCGKNLDAATPAEKENVFPKPGDVSLCVYCGEILVFNDRLLLHKPTAEQMEDFKANAEQFNLIIKAQSLIRSAALRKMTEARKN